MRITHGMIAAGAQNSQPGRAYRLSAGKHHRDSAVDRPRTVQQAQRLGDHRAGGVAVGVEWFAVDGAGAATVVWDYEDEERSFVEAASRPVGGPFAAPVQVNGPL